ncbi:MAG: hypothetical protein AAFY60_09880, partial [Myxococcota bacterium]
QADAISIIANSNVPPETVMGVLNTARNQGAFAAADGTPLNGPARLERLRTILGASDPAAMFDALQHFQMSSGRTIGEYDFGTDPFSMLARNLSSAADVPPREQTRLMLMHMALGARSDHPTGDVDGMNIGQVQAEVLDFLRGSSESGLGLQRGDDAQGVLDRLMLDDFVALLETPSAIDSIRYLTFEANQDDLVTDIFEFYHHTTEGGGRSNDPELFNAAARLIQAGERLPSDPAELRARLRAELDQGSSPSGPDSAATDGDAARYNLSPDARPDGGQLSEATVTALGPERAEVLNALLRDRPGVRASANDVVAALQSAGTLGEIETADLALRTELVAQGLDTATAAQLDPTLTRDLYNFVDQGEFRRRGDAAAHALVERAPAELQETLASFLAPSVSTETWSNFRSSLTQTPAGRQALVEMREARIARSALQETQAWVEQTTSETGTAPSAQDAAARYTELYRERVAQWNARLERAARGETMGESGDGAASADARARMFGEDPLALQIDPGATPLGLRGDDSPATLSDLWRQIGSRATAVYSATSAEDPGSIVRNRIYLGPDAFQAPENLRPGESYPSPDQLRALGVLSHEIDHALRGFEYQRAAGDPNAVAHNLTGEALASLREL